MKIQILDKAKKKKIVQEIQNLGIKKIEPLLIKTGTERIKAFTGSMSTEEIYNLWRVVPIEGIGLYFGKEMISKRTGEREIRLSLDGLHLLQKNIVSNQVYLEKEQEEQWFKGKDIELNTDEQNKYPFHKQFVVVYSQASNDIIGTGKMSADGNIIFNYLPKERQRKTSTIS